MLGMYGIDISLDYFQRMIASNNIQLYEGAGELMVISNSGLLVADSSANQSLGEDVLAGLTANLRKVIASGESALVLDLATAMYWSVQPFALIEGVKPWTIVYRVPQAVLMAQSEALQQQLQADRQVSLAIQILVALAVLTLALVLVYFTARAIVRPINRVSDVLRDIAEGEGDLTREINVEGDDEVARLAAGFNRFLGQLRLLISQVLQASKELTEAASRGAEVSTITSDSIQQQQQELGQMTSAVKEMASSAQSIADTVVNSAEETGNASETALSSCHKIT